MSMIRNTSLFVLLVLVLGLAGCGNEDSANPTATVIVTVQAAPSTPVPSTSTPMATPLPATAVATSIQINSPAAIESEPTPETAEYTLVEGSETEAFPTPDAEQRAREMAPTAVIIDGAYPYPTANSAIDSDSDGFYTIDELEQAVRETFPAYDWPSAYQPTIDDIFFMVDFDRIPPGANFEVPMDLQLLGGLNRCAWQQEWIDAFSAGDQPRMTSSMQHLRRTVLTNPMNVYIITEATDMYNQAELGNPALLLRDQQLNCTGFNSWVESQNFAVPVEVTTTTFNRRWRAE